MRPKREVQEGMEGHKKVEGPFDIAPTGIIASLAITLAGAGISIFVVSTYDTDYLLVKKLKEAIAALRREGHQVKASE